MLDMKGFKPYLPRDDAAITLREQFNVTFFISEDGRDWYQNQGAFADDTLKVAYDDRGIIRSISQDVSKIHPGGLSVAEVANTDKNRQADISGGWVYKKGKISRLALTAEQIVGQALDEKKQRLKDVEAEIAPLERAVRLDMATREDAELLSALERYSVLVNQIDVSAAPDIEWPVKPH